MSGAGDAAAGGPPGARRLVIATRNEHKLEEFRALLADLGGVEIAAAADDPRTTDVDEDAPTLAGNAEKKARWVAAFTGLPSLADDTGLEVDALGGAPGVHSARWAGPGASFADNIARLLGELGGVPADRRTARFRCVVALAVPAPDAARFDFQGRVGACRVSLHEGLLEGRILEAPRGAHGFGYDPVFLVLELGRTLAELAPGDKNRTSHRARAVAAARPALRALFDLPSA